MQPSIDSALAAIGEIARFECLVQLPAKADPDWPKWSAAATKGEKRFFAKGETEVEALANLLEELHK
jgi:hypothetical protein